MRSLSIALLLYAMATIAIANTHEDSIGISFPDEVAGLAFQGRKEFPQKELGVNIAYGRSGPVRGSVYIYNAGLGSIPAGTEAPVVRQHFSQVIREVKQMESLGKARAVNLSAAGEQVTSFGGWGPQFIWRAYELDLSDTTLTSYTYLTAMKDNFVKLRVSHRKGDTLGAQDAQSFVREIRRVLGKCQ